MFQGQSLFQKIVQNSRFPVAGLVVQPEIRIKDEDKSARLNFETFGCYIEICWHNCPHVNYAFYFKRIFI